MLDGSQLQQVEELRETEMTDLNILTEEFTKRLSEAEKKLQSSIKVRSLKSRGDAQRRIYVPR